jgi:hypothetical protein
LTITAKRRDNTLHVLLKGKKEFQYGRFEAESCQLVKVYGFWMLGSNISELAKCGEIDILEYIGKEPNMVLPLCTLKTVTEILILRKPDLITSRKVFMCTMEWTKDKSIFL